MGKRKLLGAKLGGSGATPSISAVETATSNPFEARQNKRRKQQVVNRRERSDVRNVALARSKVRSRAPRRDGEAARAQWRPVGGRATAEHAADGVQGGH